MGPWVVTLVGVLIVAAGLAIPIKGPGGIGNSRDGDPAPRRSVPAIAAGFVAVAVGVVLAWQPWGRDATASAPPPTPAVSSRASLAPAAAQSTDSSAPTDPPAPTSSAGPAAQLVLSGVDFAIPGGDYQVSHVDLSKPAGGPSVERDVSALDYSEGSSLAPGLDGLLFGYTSSPPTDAADCVAQAQRHEITTLDTVVASSGTTDQVIKTGDGFCVQDKGGDIAWLSYVGPTPHSGASGGELDFKLTLWKQSS